jgi:hypothetical protein
LHDKVFRVDVASDDWGMLSAYLSEEGEKGHPSTVSFYSVGRGLQRALLLRLQLGFSDLMLVDEIESAMHPELLEQVASWIAEAVLGGKEIVVTTQSLEAARFLAAAVSGVERSSWRSLSLLRSILSEKCENEKFDEEIRDKLSLVILRNRDGVLNSIKLDGCDAVQFILGTEDPRMSYVIVK